MDGKEFSEIRGRLGKSQRETAHLLGSSLRAVQSFEQGWRRVPIHVERQLLFLLAMKEERDGDPCWDIQACPAEVRERCPAWEFHGGRLCWFISGTMCKGKVQESWARKMKICRRCKVFRSIFGP